jgi:hypothetical protein
MHSAFTRNAYVLKRKGLAIVGNYQLLDPESGEPLLFVEDKMQWLPPKRFGHIYADESKRQEVLTLVTSDAEDIETDVIDAETGAKIGGFGMLADTLGDVIKDAWTITDASDQPIGKVFENSAGRSVVRQMLGNEMTQQLDMTLGDIPVGELRQKVKPIAYELGIDFTMDAGHALDRRMGVATAVFVAMHQGSEAG